MPEEKAVYCKDVKLAKEALAILEDMLKTCPLHETPAIRYARDLMALDLNSQVLRAEYPIGTLVYQAARCGTETETVIVDGKEYSRKVPSWCVTQHKYSWVDASCDAERPERRSAAHKEYYRDYASALAAKNRLAEQEKQGGAEQA